VTESGNRKLKAYSLYPLSEDPSTNSATVNVSQMTVFDWFVGALLAILVAVVSKKEEVWYP